MKTLEELKAEMELIDNLLTVKSAELNQVFPTMEAYFGIRQEIRDLHTAKNKIQFEINHASEFVTFTTVDMDEMDENERRKEIAIKSLDELYSLIEQVGGSAIVDLKRLEIVYNWTAIE